MFRSIIRTIKLLTLISSLLTCGSISLVGNVKTVEPIYTMLNQNAGIRKRIRQHDFNVNQGGCTFDIEEYCATPLETEIQPIDTIVKYRVYTIHEMITLSCQSFW